MTLDDYVKSDEYKEEVAVLHLVNPQTGKKINLVGAVHVGSKEYYTKVKGILEECDVILYERVIPSQNGKTTRDHFILSNGIRLNDFYRETARAISDYHQRRMYSAIKTVAAGEPAKTDLFRKLGDRFIDELTLVFQGDSIDYENLPSNWHHADMSLSELNSHIGIFSLTNLQFGLLRLISDLVLDHPHLMELAAQRIASKGLISNKTDVNIIAKLNRLREREVYERLDEFEQRGDIAKIGIFYGVGHLPYLEHELTKRGYVRQDISYLETVRKQPKLFERMDGSKT